MTAVVSEFAETAVESKAVRVLYERVLHDRQMTLALGLDSSKLCRQLSRGYACCKEYVQLVRRPHIVCWLLEQISMLCNEKPLAR